MKFKVFRIVYPF